MGHAISVDMSQIDATTLFRAGTVLWIVLWAVFIARLAWLEARLRAHLSAHHSHRWRRLSWSERLTWSVWFVFQTKEDYGDPAIGARRREMLTVFYDMLLVLAAMVVWFVVSAAMVPLGP
jgi:hypothetical protein